MLSSYLEAYFGAFILIRSQRLKGNGKEPSIQSNIEAKLPMYSFLNFFSGTSTMRAAIVLEFWLLNEKMQVTKLFRI